MPEFGYFYGVGQDWWSLISGLLSQGERRIVVDDWYSSRGYPEYQSLTDEAKSHILRGRRRVFLLGPFSNGSLSLQLQEMGARKGQYWIDSTRGSAAISLTLPWHESQRGVTRLSSGELHLPRELWTEDNSSCSPSPPDARRAFDDVKKQIKSLGRRLKCARTIWLMPAAAQELDRDRVMVNIDGQWIDAAQLRRSERGAS